MMEVVTAFSDAVDGRMPNNRGRTDLGEMAQQAASETISEVIGERTHGLLGAGPEEVRRAFSDLATVKQFSVFTKAFFGRFLNKCLNYFLSRTLPAQVGPARRFTSMAQQAAFEEALEWHCREAARIVEIYAGQWFSKKNWLDGGITRAETVKFTGYAMKKLMDELREGAAVHA